MSLTYRPTQLKDFEACFRIIRNGFVFTRTRSQNDLKALWRMVFQEGSALSAVIEDRNRPAGNRIVAHGFSVFLSAEFAHRTRTNLPAYPSYRLLRFWREGKRHFLNAREIARLNGDGGLDILTLHYGWDKNLPKEQEMQARLKLMETFQVMHAGWKVRQFLQEVYGVEEKEIMEGIGMRVRRDYREAPVQPRPPASSNPYLMGYQREEKALQETEFVIARVFQYTPPRFRFSAGEKEMLGRALMDETDLEISSALRLSPWTVKKRWQGVYRKVDRRDPALLKSEPKPGAVSKEPASIRRRRRLMDYLRQHMEEIRPTLGGKKS